MNPTAPTVDALCAPADGALAPKSSKAQTADDRVAMAGEALTKRVRVDGVALAARRRQHLESLAERWYRSELSGRGGRVCGLEVA